MCPLPRIQKGLERGLVQDKCMELDVIYVCRHHEGRGRVMVRRGGRRKEGGKSRENFLYGSLASAKQERCLFNRVCSQPCG